MSDRVRIVRPLRGGRLYVEQDLEQEKGIYQRAVGTFKIAASAPNLVTAQATRARQGSPVVDRNDPAKTVSGTWRVRGDTKDEAIRNAEEILAQIDSGRRGRMIEWRPDGATHSVLLRVVGPGTWDCDYKWHQFYQSNALDFTLSWPVEPIGEGQPWDVWEEFQPNAAKVDGLINEVLSPSGEPGHVPITTTGYAWLPENASTQVEYRSAGGRSGANTPGGFALEAQAAIPGVTTFRAASNQTAWASADYGRSTRVVTGDTIKAQGWVKAVVASSSLRLILRAYDAAGANVGTITLATQSSPVTGTYYFLSGTYTVAAGATFITLGVEITTNAAPGAAGDLLAFDEMLLALNPPSSYVPASGAYLDGDMATARWEGIPHASRSLETAESSLVEFTLLGGSQWAVNHRALQHTGPNSQGLLLTGRNTPPLIDDYIVVEVQLGTDVTAANIDLMLSYIDANNYIGSRITFTKPAGFLLIAYTVEVVVNGVRTPLVSSPATAVGGITGDKANRLFLYLLRQGDRIFTGQTLDFPGIGQTAATTSVVSPTTSGAGTSLSSTQSALFRNGGDAGFKVNPSVGGVVPEGWAICSVVREPYTYYRGSVGSPQSLPMPRQVQIKGIPGPRDAPPAKADISIEPGPDATVPEVPWAAIGWAALADPEDMMWNGGFETAAGSSTAGWNVTAVGSGGGQIVVGATLGTDSQNNVTGKHRGVITFPATANTGIWTYIGRHLQQGRTYTMEAWVASTNATPVEIAIYKPTGQRFSLSVTPTPEFRRYRFQFTPTADIDTYMVQVKSPTAVARTVYVDAISVYPGTEPPTNRRDGAVAPFGCLFGNYVAHPLPSGWAIDSGYSVNNASTPAGAATHSLPYYIDPSLIEPPELRSTYQVDVFAFYSCGQGLVNPKMSLRLESEEAPGAQPQYGQPWGSAGRPLVKGTSGAMNRVSKVGTLTMESDPDIPGRLKLTVTISQDAGSTGSTFALYYLVLLPTHSRCLLPTGKQNDAAYPDFANHTTRSMRRTIMSDLTSVLQSAQTRQGVVDGSMGGEPILLPVGRDLAILPWATKGANAVPDDPTIGPNPVQELQAVGWHVGITPRYNLAAY